MTDREKVIRAVGTCFDSWIDKHRDMGLDLHEVERMKRDALELLKEQEPVEPDGENCGECGYTLHRINYDGPDRGLRHEWFRFCPVCGKAVKWDAAD